MNRVVCLCAGMALVTSASATVVTTDFSVGPFGPLVNGQVLVGDEVSQFFTLSSSGNNAGLTVFDTDPTGPNATSDDEDLLVGLGNALILQNNHEDDVTGGVYDDPDDDRNGGIIAFDFIGPVQLLSLDLIDMNGGNGGTVTLTDLQGDTAVFTIPESWTFDIGVTPTADGFATLDLTDFNPQDAEGVGGPATAVVDANFDGTQVVGLDIFFVGSGGVDNVTYDISFIPTPGVAAIAAAGGLVCLRRRR